MQFVWFSYSRVFVRKCSENREEFSTMTSSPKLLIWLVIPRYSPTQVQKTNFTFSFPVGGNRFFAWIQQGHILGRVRQAEQFSSVPHDDCSRGPDLNRNELILLSRFRKGVGRCNCWDTDSVKISRWRSTSHEWLWIWCSNYGSRQLFTSLASLKERERYFSRSPQCLPDSNSFYRCQFHFKHWQYF